MTDLNRAEICIHGTWDMVDVKLKKKCLHNRDADLNNIKVTVWFEPSFKQNQ